MRRYTVTPAAYRRITFLALVALGVIIVTGAGVRLTGSGLGCPDWPTCANERVVAPLEYHALVEFLNRAFTGLVSLAIMAAVLGSLLLKPRRRDLTILSLGLVAGVIGQIILGGQTVKHELAPQYVMSHFLLSMVLVWNAVVLHHRASTAPGRARRLVTVELTVLARLLFVAAAGVVFLGTIVTSSGPHGGDEEAPRFDLDLHDVAQLHGGAVILFLALTAVTLALLVRNGAPASVVRAAEVLLAVIVAQGFVGYLQYFTGVPVVLVAIHIAGAVAVWVATIRFNLVLVAREPVGTQDGVDPAPVGSPRPALATR